MRFSFRARPSQALLFAPAALLCLLGVIVTRNSFTRPVIRAEDSPDGKREALIFLDHSLAYPFAGGVRATLEVRLLPGHEVVLTRELGAHRWASQARSAYSSIDWREPGRITLLSADRSTARSLIYSPRLSREVESPGSRRGR